jgi:sugar lactone lactonase YvrE
VRIIVEFAVWRYRTVVDLAPRCFFFAARRPGARYSDPEGWRAPSIMERALVLIVISLCHLCGSAFQAPIALAGGGGGRFLGNAPHLGAVGAPCCGAAHVGAAHTCRSATLQISHAATALAAGGSVAGASAAGTGNGIGSCTLRPSCFVGDSFFVAECSGCSCSCPLSSPPLYTAPWGAAAVAVVLLLLLCLRAGARGGPSSGAPLLAQRCAVLALLFLHGALAACPGAAAPGYFCVGAVETLCQSGKYCIGGAAPAIPCMTPANCAEVGLSAEPGCFWNVTTLAGNGGTTFANGQGAAATFNLPSGVAADTSGVVYVADLGNDRIREVTSSGFVSTLAGSGTATWADGTGAAASFNRPQGVATYPGSGIIYVADSWNNRIRKLTPSGVTTTFAGDGWNSGPPSYSGRWADGQGTSASFRNPTGLTVDSAGVVYVADRLNHRIRKITPLGAVTTLAGTGSIGSSDGVGTSTATFDNPSGVAVDGNGNVYVGDIYNHRIRLILPNGTVSTFAGSGSGTWADGTGTSAGFFYPEHLSIAANGNLLVADTYKNLIRMITPLGAVTTIAGGSTASFLDGYGTASRLKYPSGITVNSAGTLYIGDRDNNLIRALSCVVCPAGYSCSTGIPTLCPAGSFCPLGSLSPTLCPAGTYGSTTGLANSFCSGICRAAPGFYCPAGSTMPNICSAGSFCAGGGATPTPCSTPDNCAPGLGAEPPCVWLATTLAGSGGNWFSDGQGTAAIFNQPRGVAEDVSGILYVADCNNHRIRALTPSGLVSTLAGIGWGWADGTGAAARFDKPVGVAIYSGSGIIYVADSSNKRIRKLTPSGVTTTFAGSSSATWADGQGTSASFRYPSGLTVDSAGVVYVADTWNYRIRKITPLGAVTTLAGTGSSTPFSNGVGTITATFNYPSGIAVDGSGNVYVGDTGNHRIRLILPNGTVSTFAGSGSGTWADGTGTSAGFFYPEHLSIAANGNLLVADTYNNLIRMITPLGAVTTIAGGSTASFLDGYGTASRFNYPTGVAVSSNYTIFIGDKSNHRIRALTCELCLAGQACTSGAPLPCAAGSLCPFASFYEADCPAGSFCPDKTYATPCPAGSFCPARSVSPQLCPPGSYTSVPGRKACILCGPGLLAPQEGSTQCDDFCPIGTFRARPGGANDSSCTLCSPGTFGEAEGATSCTPCPVGSAGGTAAGANSSATCTPCAPGSFSASLTGAAVCSLCLPGTYAIAGASACTPCPSGAFSGGGASSCAACPLGSAASLTGSTSCTNCSAGYYADTPGAPQCTPCPSGRYSNSPAQISLSSCSFCPAGSYNPSSGQTSSGCISCSPGKFSSSAGASDATQCSSCAPGSIASTSGSTSCSLCQQGTYTSPEATSCLPCPIGMRGAISGGANLTAACVLCPHGSFASAAGSTSCTNCSAGYYADTPGAPQCTPCPSGRFSSASAQTSISSCSFCPAGSYNPSSGQTSSGCISCSPGKFSSSAGASDATQCSPCAPGSIAPTSGSTSCAICQQGMYTSSDATSCLPCPIGMRGAIAGGANLSAACVLCPLGSFSSTTGSTGCTTCSAGFFADTPGLSSCTPCPIGTFNNLPSSNSPSACLPCPSGTFNPSQGQTSSGCISCPPGTASSTPGASSLSQCTPCSSGTYASLVGSSSCIVSPAGSFSAPPLSGGGTGATSPTLCPLGTFSGIPSAISVTQCTACPSGKTTASTGATQDTQCLALPFACPAGKQPNFASASSLSDCAPLTCPQPLRPSAFAGYGSDSLALATSLSCLGCASGTMGTLPACTLCDGTAFCPGFTSRPLFNFSGDASASGAPRALVQGSGTPTSPFSACPTLASLTKSASTTTLPSAATSTVFFGVPLPTTSSQSLLAWVVIFSWLFILALLIVFSRATENATGCSALPLRALKALDLFSMNHKVEDKTSPIKEATSLGGLFSLMGLTTLLTYAAYMVAIWLQDNTLVQQSLATMGPSVWGRVASLPWAASPAVSSLGSLALRLTIDGNPGACAAPLSTATTGLARGLLQ